MFFWQPEMEGAHQHDKGGRGSTATQPTHRELAPEHAAGKVPVPLGRECQWETTGQRLKRAVKLCVELFARELALAAAQSCREHSRGCQLNGAHSPHASFRDRELCHAGIVQLCRFAMNLHECRGTCKNVFLAARDGRRSPTRQRRQRKHGHAANTQGARS